MSCCIIYTAAFVQQQYQFENYTTAHGLSDNRVTCFYKDRDGFMWIGTENGLNRFDGHTFLVYNAGRKKQAISNPYINDIEQDANGNLWVATQSGLNFIDLKKDSTLFFTTNNDGYRQTAETIPSNLIWDTYPDHAGRVWIAADVRDLCYYDTLKKSFHYISWKQYVLEKFPHRSKSYNSIRKIYFKSNDELWLGTSVGLFSYHIPSNTFTHYPSDEADIFTSLQQAANRQVYYMQEPGKDVQVLEAEHHYKRISFTKVPAEYENLPSAETDYILWFPAGQSLAGIDSRTGSVRFVNHITDNPYSLPAGNVRTTFKDNYGLVWVATDNGIGKFNPSMNFFPFTAVTAAPPVAEPEYDLYRLKHNVHTVFYSQQDDKYYISSTRFNCLYIIDKKTGERQTITHASGIPLTNCSVIREKNNSELYILSGINVFIYNRNTKKFRRLPFTSKSKNLLFTDMAEDNNGHIWFACLNDGLYRYDTLTHAVWAPAGKDSFHSTLPTSLYFDKPRNKLWIGTFEYGLYDFDCSGNRFTNYNQGSNNDEYIRSSLINDIIPDKYNNIWIATYADGISRLSFIDEKPKSQEGITSSEGLPENNVFSLAADKQGNIWATTFKGISKLSTDGRVLKNYDHTAGLPYSDFYSPLTATDNGTLITAVSNGFVSFKPDSLSYHPSSFNTVITSFRVKTKDQFVTANTSLPVALSYSSNEVQFDFAALNYHFSSQTKYSYMLEGQDKTYSIGNQHSVIYNNLAPGSYVFKVKATDFSGNASQNEATLSFSIAPPLWQTWWFRLLAGAIVVAAILLAFISRIKNIRNKAMISQQIAELKGHALRAQMNPHFIFNSLNAIQELIVTENYPASYQYLSKFSKLLRSVLNLSEKNFIPLSLEIEICNLYLELESLRFNHSFYYKIDSGNIETDVVQFPTLLIQPFIENAIWHGLRQKEGEKKVTVTFTEKDDWITCTIRDNGIGRERAAAIKAGKIGSEHFTSKGIVLARQRLDSLIAAGTGKGSIDIADCKDEAGGAAGTEVKINFFVLKDINT
ncbi:MAG: histidine kinase [Chitinophagaceae bacterium]|nr:histidine kinase [Chitinophagaceae bacterium]